MQSTTTITGRIVKDAVDTLTIRGDKPVADVTIAVEDHRLPGETRFIQVPQWETASARAAQYLTKGRWVTAEGLLDARPYTDRDGNLQIGWTLRRGHIEFGPNPQTLAGDAEDRDPVAAGATGNDDDIPF